MKRILTALLVTLIGCPHTETTTTLDAIREIGEPTCVDAEIVWRYHVTVTGPEPGVVRTCMRRTDSGLAVDARIDTERDNVEADEFIMVLALGDEILAHHALERAPRTEMGVEEKVYRYRTDWQETDFPGWQSGQYEVRYYYNQRSDISRLMQATGTGDNLVGDIIREIAGDAEASGMGTITVQ